MDIQALLDVLPVAGQGWLGVFIVTIVIVLAVYILNWCSDKFKKD